MSPPLLAKTSKAAQVLTTIEPVQALVQTVLKGSGIVSAPLLDGKTSVHNVRLKPSQYQQLSKAKLLIMISPELESFLVKPLKAQGAHLNVLILAESQEITLREFEHHHTHQGDKHKIKEHRQDFHLWLDPINVIALLESITELLKQQYPAHEALFEKNKQTAQEQFKVLHQSLLKRFEAVSSVPFIVFHDGYGYFEERYKLNKVGVITLNPSQGLSAKQLASIRHKLMEKKVQCVFSEVQFSKKIVKTVTKGSEVRVVELNPHYTDTSNVTANLSKLADDFIRCLQ